MSTSLRLLLPRQLYSAMLSQAKAELPNECCGLLAGTIGKDGLTRSVGEAYPLVNEAASPVRYAVEKHLVKPFRAMRNANLELLAIYHSHPTTPPVPSKTDLAQWYHGPDVACIIISLTSDEPEVRAWCLDGDSFDEVVLEVR